MSEEQPIELETPWRRDPEELAARLSEWVRAAIAADRTVVDVHAPGNGMSSETVLFDVRDHDGTIEHYVARLAPLPEVYPVFPEYDLELQRRCMELAREHTDVPAPEVPYSETDPAWLGSPFIVMRRIEGIPPLDVPPYVFDGWVMDATPEDRARMQRNAVRVLAQLHTITPETHDLSFLLRPEFGDDPLDQQLGYQRWYYDWAREGATYPLIERTFDWLAANRPAGLRTVLNWGDSRIGNMLWQDFEPVAVLDWEMATVGPPEVDVAWMIFLHSFFQDLAARFEMPGLPDFMDRAEIIATYEELTGHALQRVDWFEVYAALRFAIVSIRTSTRGIAYGSMEKPEDPDDLVMFRTLLEQMLAGTYWN
ncbi:MAG: phosphotransferase family protein [Acidimicrobiia bacterium]